MHPRPAKAPGMLGWAATTLRRGGSQAERFAEYLATRSGSQPSSRQPIALSQTISQPAFEHTIQTELELAMRTNRTVSVLAISIDHFDVVTAGHGPRTALEVLAVAATRLRDAVRTDDVLTRYGSDGFVLLWAPTSAAADTAEIASRIAAQFDRPVMTAAGQLPITVSIGISSVTGHQAHMVDALTLQRQAQTAVASAQYGGRAQMVVFDQALQARAIESYETERHLRAAVRNNDLSVNYQPIVSLHSGSVVGVEALARWCDESLGSVSPATFIPIAEDSGLIGELGLLIMQASIEQAATWNRARGEDTLVTVNLSNRQLLDPDLIPSLASLLEQNDLDPGRLCLEITESVVMNNVAASMTILGHMKDLGLVLAIDDFGTGYSSLSYLRRLPVDILKIDRSFVQSVYNRDDRVITKAIIDLAHTLGMTTIAEGVETRLQVEVLHALNCDMAQGFLLHPPTTAKSVDFSIIDFESFAEDASFNESHGSRSAPSASTSQAVRQ